MIEVQIQDHAEDVVFIFRVDSIGELQNKVATLSEVVDHCESLGQVVPTIAKEWQERHPTE